MDFDLLIQGATVVPGNGPTFTGDVGLKGSTIAAVASALPSDAAASVIDGRGRLLLPGFIDMHAHSALVPFHDPSLIPKLAQGFTTEHINPDGLAPAPVVPGREEELRAYLKPLEGPGPATWSWSTMDAYLAALSATRPATTLVPAAGHNTVRLHVMGAARRSPSTEELIAMRRHVREALEAGGRTLSFGLIYLPGLFAQTDELIAMAEEAARFGAPLVPHMRNEGADVLEAAREMIRVARISGAPLHISHLKIIGNAHLVDPLLALLDEAAREIDMSFDQYPYGAGSTMLSALLPPWAQEGGPETIVARLEDAAVRHRIMDDTLHGLPGWENVYGSCGPENVYIADAKEPSVVGKTLEVLGEASGKHPLEVTMDLIHDLRLSITMVDHYATEEVVRALFRHPLGLVGSDGIFGLRPHPRLYGTAARVLGRYVLKEGLIPLEEAAARLTSRPARRLGLRDRGTVTEGLRADLVLIDPETYVDVSTYDDPQSTPPGVDAVVVGGQIAYARGTFTGVRAGGVITTPRPR